LAKLSSAQPGSRYFQYLVIERNQIRLLYVYY